MYIQTSNQDKLELGFGRYSCNWGTHFCGLYETDEERDEIIFGFLHYGNISGDLQLYCPVERTKEDFFEKYRISYPEYSDRLTDTNYFQFYSAKELYYPTGIFSPWDMDRNLDNFYENSQRNGRKNIRATAEMSWALEAIPGVEYLMAYEARLNYFIPSKPWISICMYDVRKFPGAIVMKVLQTHPYTINGGVITQNPFYQDPTEYLSKYAPQFLNKEN